MSDRSPDTGPLVLIAEDEPLASMALRAQLEALDYQVLGPARDGNEAVALGACHPVDIALFDMRMPGRSGLQAALDLFELAPTPVVLLTGVGAADLPDPIPRPPIFEILSKPVSLNDISAALDAARSGFQDSPDDADHVRRTTIARAVQLLAGTDRPAAAAAHILERARNEDRSLSDVAREILDAAHA